MIIPSLKKRYAAKLAANLVGLGIGMVTQAIIPRGLGPKAYGDFNFLSNFFSQLMPFLSLSSSMGFYTKISQRQNEFGLVSFYFQFTGFVILATFIFVGCSQVFGLSSVFWIDQSMSYVYMAAIFSTIVALTGIFIQMADAYGITVSTEMAKIIQKCFGLLIICALFFSHQLNLVNYFFYQYAILIFLSLANLWIMARNSHSLKRNWSLTRQQIKGYVHEFYEYCHPLFVYSLMGMLVGILDRWMLQKFAGSVQQGYFGLSIQIGAICFLFTSAMTALITREFSIAYAKQNIREMARLFRRYIPLLYSIAAFFACFSCVQAEKITYIFGGAKFSGASLPVAIMALYPIHQTYGQLSGSVFYATGQTALYRNIGLIFMVIGLPFAYMMIAPSSQFGLGAGATGLAVKFLVFQFITVNAGLFYNSRFLKLRFMRYLGHQVLCVACLISVATVVKYVIDSLPEIHDKIILSFLISGGIYSVSVMAIGYSFPVIFGLTREDVIGMATKLIAFVQVR